MALRVGEVGREDSFVFSCRAGCQANFSRAIRTLEQTNTTGIGDWGNGFKGMFRRARGDMARVIDMEIHRVREKSGSGAQRC